MSSSKPFAVTRTKEDLIKRRQDIVKWNGWGYKDTRMHAGIDNVIHFEGPRYCQGRVAMPTLFNFLVDNMGVSGDIKTPSQPEMPARNIPEPMTNDSFMEELKKLTVSYSDDRDDRLFRAHGQSFKEIFYLREGKFERVPDLVVWPANHSQAAKIVELATQHNVVLIPFGGGTCVSNALHCPEEETRMIVSVDTCEMNRILWINSSNLTMRAQAGITLQDLERQLAARGFCTGHEPDSREFSTLGGSVATRTSGKKKNSYGDIEDLLVHVTMVTPKGVIEKKCEVPRLSCGPDIHHFILGSEGTLGLITEVSFKIQVLPPCKKYSSIAFPDFETGLRFLRDLAVKKNSPSSIMLMDNAQFQFACAMRPQASTSVLTNVKDSLKSLFITKFKGFDPSRMAMAVLMVEGTKESVAQQDKKINALAVSMGGIPGDDEDGERGFFLDLVHGYVRDMLCHYCIISETFETSVPWSRCLDICQNVKERVLRESKNKGLQTQPFMTCKVTQTYEVGASISFFLAFAYTAVPNVVEMFEQLMACVRDEILANGGSISHHLGAGKAQTQWLRQSYGDVGLGSVQALKKFIDPENIFGSNNQLMGQPPHEGVLQGLDHLDDSLPSKL